MSPISCPFCGKSSAADAKFCIECGGALHLVPCPACGAVNDLSAAICFQCGGLLGGRSADPVDPGPVETQPAAGRRNRQPAWIAAAVAMLAGIGALGYYALASRTEVASPAVPAPADERPVEARPQQSEGGAGTTVLPAPLPAEVPPIGVPSPARAERKAVESFRPQARKAPARGPQETIRQETARGSGPVACTAQALALGLCREADEAPAPVAPAARDDESCSPEAAALGLCASASSQGEN